MKLVILASSFLMERSQSAVSTFFFNSNLHSSSPTKTSLIQTTISLFVTIFPSSSRTDPCSYIFNFCILVERDFQSYLFSLGFISTVRTSSPEFDIEAKPSNSSRNLFNSALQVAIYLLKSLSQGRLKFSWWLRRTYFLFFSLGSLSIQLRIRKYSHLIVSISLKSSISLSSQQLRPTVLLYLEPSQRANFDPCDSLKGVLLLLKLVEVLQKSYLSISCDLSIRSIFLSNACSFCWQSFTLASIIRVFQLKAYRSSSKSFRSPQDYSNLIPSASAIPLSISALYYFS